MPDKPRRKIREQTKAISGNLQSAINHIHAIAYMIMLDINPITNEIYHPELLVKCSEYVEFLTLVKETVELFYKDLD